MVCLYLVYISWDAASNHLEAHLMWFNISLAIIYREVCCSLMTGLFVLFVPRKYWIP